MLALVIEIKVGLAYNTVNETGYTQVSAEANTTLFNRRLTGETSVGEILQENAEPDNPLNMETYSLLSSDRLFGAGPHSSSPRIEAGTR
jgi:hypothetical protein